MENEKRIDDFLDDLSELLEKHSAIIQPVKNKNRFHIYLEGQSDKTGRCLKNYISFKLKGRLDFVKVFKPKKITVTPF